MENTKLNLDFMKKENVESFIRDCEGKHIQQVAFSTYHNAFTQICFGCGRIRTSLPKKELEVSGD